MSQTKDRAVYELKFWLQIMGDHARFIKGSLNPDQLNLILIAENFKDMFERMLEKVRQGEAVRECFLNEISQLTLSFRDYKRELLADRLKNLPITTLTPTFYNHMLNELEDFLRVICDLENATENSGNIVGLHLLWSLDAAGHAAILAGDLDKVESELQRIAKEFEQLFNEYYLKVVEIAGYFRSSPPSVTPVLEAYNMAITASMKEFMIYLEELKNGVIQQKVLGRLLPLAPDHMYREECYYLQKIAQFQPDLAIPACDPGKPRIM